MTDEQSKTTELGSGASACLQVEPRLCYVEGAWAYFTTQALDEQWGDDWDDAPYESNAGHPYEPCWHNSPTGLAQENGRGWKPGTETPLARGERCQCRSCIRDWNPDGTPRWEVIKVAWDGPFETPDSGHLNSPYSVQDINAGALAWLRPSSWRSDLPRTPIPAGATVSEFRRIMEAAGGSVYFKATVEGINAV